MFTRALLAALLALTAVSLGCVGQQSTLERPCARSALCAGSSPCLGHTSGFAAMTAPECGSRVLHLVLESVQ